MNYRGIVFVADDYNEIKLMEILANKLPERNKNGLYNKYLVDKNFKEKPWSNNYIKKVKDIKNYVPRAIVIVNDYGQTLFFYYLYHFYPEGKPELNLGMMNDNQWKRFVQSVYMNYMEKYAVLINFET